MTLGDDRVCGVQAQSGARPWVLGREERVEEPLPVLFGDAGTVVLDLHPHPRALSGDPDDDPGRVPISRGIDGVIQKFGPHLGELAPVGLDRGHIFCVLLDQLDPIEHRAEDADRVLDALHNVHLLDRGLVQI